MDTCLHVHLTPQNAEDFEFFQKNSPKMHRAIACLRASSINDLGEIAGAASAGDSKTTRRTAAFRYNVVDGMLDLGTLSTDKDFKSSWAWDINNWGETVGVSHSGSFESARSGFLHTDEFGLLSLADLTLGVPWDALGSRNFLTYWTNDWGDVAGPIRDGVSGYHDLYPHKAFLLRRVPGKLLTFVSTDTPKTIADPTKRGATPTTSQISISSSANISSTDLDQFLGEHLLPGSGRQYLP